MASVQFYRRRFLNRRGHHAGAYVIANVRREPLLRNGSPVLETWASLTIADCGRVVTLDFDMPNARARSNALHKARLLRDVIDQFVAALEASGASG